MISFERGADGLLVARRRVAVGLADVWVEARIDRWTAPAPDATGLAERPVVLVRADDAALELARAGVRRSGRFEADVVSDGSNLGRDLLRSPAEAALVVGWSIGTIEQVAAIGGRPLPAAVLAADGAPLAACRIGVEVAVPAGDGAPPPAAALHERHHVVEVDPRPAFDELGWEVGGASAADLVVAAAGVLAGRLAAGNRRWRDER